MRDLPVTKRIFLTNGTAVGWIAVLFQLYLMIANRSAPIPETLIRFFSFFTILTNIAVALCCSFLLLDPGSRAGRFFGRPTTISALTVYIAVVGIVYNTILRGLWHPQGLQLVVDELLHAVMPVLFALYWIVCTPKVTLKWSHIPGWLIFPAVYCVYILVRGNLSGFYPYPFIDVGVLGIRKALINIGGMLLLFVGLSALLVGAAKLASVKRRP